jgi:hypothetical protein
MKRALMIPALVMFFCTFGVAGKSLSDYPLAVEIVESHWHNHRDGSVNGWGQGNIREGDSIHGFDFTYEASAPFHRTRGDDHYLGKWKKNSLRMELIVGEIGSVNKYQAYDLHTSMRDEVYVFGPNGAEPISQEEYRAHQSQPQAPPAQQQQ